MRGDPRVLALGVADEEGVFGTGGVRARWSELGVAPPGTGRTFRALFDTTHPTFRRLDRASRVLVLATEATGLPRRLGGSVRDDVALVAETERGSVETDLRFQRSLERGVVEGALFPSTLPNTSLGEVAQRHRLRGPTCCLSIEAGQRGDALREAARILADGDARYVLACRVEASAEPVADLAPALSSVAVLLAAPGEEGDVVAPWPGDDGDGFAVLASAVRRRG